jgi:GT2 family glycosyltransferase
LNQNYPYKIAIIIVNYNVEYFLEQCLNSVKKALQGINGEVFIVDNNSIDGSIDMVKRKFGEFNLIANKDNKGFSKANNQAIELCNSEYVLLLNPDTVIEEDTLHKVIDFMDKHPEAGGLGVRMVDGKGQFLPESKRGLPTPAVAFYKIFGLSRLFPSSKTFGQYHAGHLSEFEINEIQILSGAFMLMRNDALKKVGLLDESFFMYGEDIDLSYRILKGGYKNFYFPETRIIHYKGESTKKSSVNYVFVFYRAMVIFAEKHFSQKNARLFSLLINAAIYFRASLAILTRFIKKSILALSDYVILLLGLFAMTHQWKKIHIDFPEHVLNISIPTYTILWMIGIFFSGGYDQPAKFKDFLKGSFLSTLFILIIYALLPKSWQFSRLFILTGALWVISYYILSRIFLHFSIGKTFSLSPIRSKRLAIIGSQQEFDRVTEILKHTHLKFEFLERVSTSIDKEDSSIGTINQLDQIIHIHAIDEVIFCARDTSASNIIHWMTSIPANIEYKIAQPDSLSLIGSNSIETAGDLYVLNMNAVSRKDNVRIKRTFDLLLSTMLLTLSPILLFNYSNKRKFLKNIFNVWTGQKSIVGYNFTHSQDITELPRIKPGVLFPSDEITYNEEGLSDKLNLIYARDYQLKKDISILLKAWTKLDR